MNIFVLRNCLYGGNLALYLQWEALLSFYLFLCMTGKVFVLFSPYCCKVLKLDFLKIFCMNFSLTWKCQKNSSSSRHCSLSIRRLIWAYYQPWKSYKHRTLVVYTLFASYYCECSCCCEFHKLLSFKLKLKLLLLTFQFLRWEFFHYIKHI